MYFTKVNINLKEKEKYNNIMINSRRTKQKSLPLLYILF